MYAHAGRLHLSGWRGLFLLLMMGGVGAAYLGVHFGFSSTNQLSGTFPSGLCFGLNVFCGIALAAGCFTVATVASIVGGREWHVIGKATLLAGALGYFIAILGANATEHVGSRAWLALWSSYSMVSGAAWTVILLGLLLLAEFLPECSLNSARSRWYALLKQLDLPLLIFATFLAAMHQFGLNRLIRGSEARLSPLWTGPSLLPLFYLSSIALGLAVVLFASWRSLIAFQRGLPETMQPVIARLLAAVIFVYLVVRMLDLMERGLIGSVFGISRESLLVLLELVLLVCGMLWIHGSESNPRELFFGSTLIIIGVITNRLNTDITALEAGTGQTYLPRWTEFLIAYSLIAAGVAGFVVGVKHLSVFADIRSAEA